MHLVSIVYLVFFLRTFFIIFHVIWPTKELVLFAADASFELLLRHQGAHYQLKTEILVRRLRVPLERQAAQAAARDRRPTEMANSSQRVP